MKNLLAILVVFSCITSLAHAEVKEETSKDSWDGKTTRSKGGATFRHVLNGNQFQVAFQGSQFYKEGIFHMGGEFMYQGSYVSTNGYALGGSLLFGVEKANKPTVYGGTLGLGLASYYTVPNIPAATLSLLVQPEAYFGLVLGHGFRIVASAGYSAHVSQSSFSGAVLGIRFERKTDTTVVGVDD